MTTDQTPIVADGSKRLREAMDYNAVRGQLLVTTREKYAEALRHASWRHRCWIAWTIRREVAAALAEQFPSGSLHVMTRTTD